MNPNAAGGSVSITELTVTGDASQLMVYVAAMGAAALLLGAAVVARKRSG